MAEAASPREDGRGSAAPAQEEEHHYQSRRKPLPHLPTPPDLGRRPKKEPNISSYDGVTEYLAVLYNHYREDFLSQLRNAITSFRDFFGENSDSSSEEDSSEDEDTEETQTNFLNSPIRDGTIYQVLNINAICEPYMMTISMRGFNRLADDKFWARSELLKPGSLVALSTDNFKSFTYILIKDDFRESGHQDRTANQRVTHLRRRDTRNLQIELYPKCSFDILKSGNPICAIEPRSYFEAHRYVLDRIQEFQAEPHLMPLQQYIVEQSTEVQRPAYLSKTRLNLSRKDELKLNKSQKSAMEYVLEHEVALIQGPPGTGKTFVGVNLVKCLSGMNEKIVITAFTNHAVDHFILECERHGARMDHLVRLGRQYCDAVHKYSLEARRDHWSCGTRAVIRKANIFAMTTSGACKFQSLVEMGEPKIVMVEEAAHITEAHLIAGLPTSCQHLILIGDYFQLRPGVGNTARHYYLDLSLYERLIKGRLVGEGLESRMGLPTVNLTPQYRMHPELAKVLVPHFYHSLDTDASCTTYPAVMGLPMRVVFFQHDNKVTAPDKRETQSRTNKFEVEFLTRLCQYLLQNGHKEASITILSTNREQSKAIHDKLVSLDIQATWDTRREDQAEGKIVHREYQKGIRVTTVDSFQGEQNDILLVSFVSTSFSSLVPTRKVTTALSSARHGFYALGNFDDYVENAEMQLKMRVRSDQGRSRTNVKAKEDPFGRCPDLGLKLWRELHEHWSDPENWECAEEGILLPYLPIQCPRDGRVSKIFLPEHFDKYAPAGGCTYQCQTRFCSHYACERVCHPGDDHTSQCTQTVTVIYPGRKRESMTCQQLRKHRPRGGERVELTFLGCSHVKKVSLEDATSGKISKCEARETHKLKCGHSVTGKCGQPIPSCQQYVIAPLPCGHEGPTVVCGELTRGKLADLAANCSVRVVVDLACGHRVTKMCSVEQPPAICDVCEP